MLKKIKARYIPLLAVYFSMGFAGLASIASTFFMKNSINLSASELISLGIWTMLPWSIKMVFGTVIDGVQLFGNNRKSYIYLGNTLILLSVLGAIDHASSQILIHHLGQYGGLLVTGLLSTMGIVIANIVASTMAVEVVDPAGNVQEELGTIQVLTRISLEIGGLLGAVMSGWLAANFATATVFALTAICPIISIICTYSIKLNSSSEPTTLNKSLLTGGLLYALTCVLCGMYLGGYAQTTVFVVSMLVISGMLFHVLKSMNNSVKTPFVLSMIAIFLFRTTPGTGPGLTWYYIDKLHFDEKFLGSLNIAGSVVSLLLLGSMLKYLAKANTARVLTILTIVITILSLPDIVVYYGWHELIGISARHLILIDTAAAIAISQMSMVPLGVIIAKNAPRNERAIYISLTASLMNIALVLGDLITKWLNDIFVVTRTDFSQLGVLMIWSLVISTALSILGLLVLRFNK